jgi:predicted O-linked N-acetylglucosamine transferase (SPINDLY family)
VAAATLAEAAFTRGFALHQRGRLEEARILYEEALRLQPGHFNALHLLGVVALRTNQAEQAVNLIGQALKIDPKSEAANNNLGNALSALHLYDAALASYDEAIALGPHSAEAHNNRGNALRGLKRCEAALASYDAAIALRTDYAAAYNNRGAALADLERHEAALASYDQAIALAPNGADAHNNRGNALRELARHAEALESYDRAIALKADFATAHNNRGAALADLERHAEAIKSYDRAIALDPDYADAHTNRGIAWIELKRFEPAIASFDKAIALEPDCADVHNHRGNALFELRQFEAAIASYNKAIELKPDLKSSYGLRVLSRMQICDWRGLETDVAQLAERIERNHPFNPFVVLASSDSTELSRKAAQIFVRERYPENKALGPISRYPRHEKIRIGYFSADFRDHPVAALAVELFERHDRGNFEVTAFYFGPDVQDEMRKRVERAFHRFIDVRGKSDQEVAQLARGMEIDIAVDLGGFTQDCRTNIFALRAAPVQVNYLGYPGTMGADYMDYLIADRTVIPQAARGHYREKIIYLPNSYLPVDSTRAPHDRAFTREELGLPPAGFVFCCFNNSYKIACGTFDRWMRILARVDGSVLWLSESNATAADNLRREAAARHIDPERLIFAKRLPSPSEHLARYRVADLFIDTFPYNAHATASDALWAGLPVLTCLGEAFAGRVAASLLNAAQLPELIASTPDQYEEAAVELALNPKRLAEIKQRLADRRPTPPLFNTALYTKHIEAAYTKIYDRSHAGLSAEDLYVAE